MHSENLVPVLKIVQTFLENIVSVYVYHLAKSLGLMSYDYIMSYKNAPCLIYYLVSYALSYVLIMTSQIWKFKGWLKIQKPEHLESGT